MFPDCSGAATGDGVNDPDGRDKTSPQSWGGTRHQSELAHTSLHLVFCMGNMHLDCSGAAELWLAQERSRQQHGR